MKVKLFAFLLVPGLLISGPWAVQAKPATHKVKIENMQFAPTELTVSRGDTVVWENLDLVPHTATAENHQFDSKTIEPGKSWKFVPRKAGTMDYKCLFHLPMKARLIVR